MFSYSRHQTSDFNLDGWEVFFPEKEFERQQVLRNKIIFNILSSLFVYSVKLTIRFVDDVYFNPIGRFSSIKIARI